MYYAFIKCHESLKISTFIYRASWAGPPTPRNSESVGGWGCTDGVQFQGETCTTCILGFQWRACGQWLTCNCIRWLPSLLLYNSCRLCSTSQMFVDNGLCFDGSFLFNKVGDSTWRRQIANTLGSSSVLAPTSWVPPLGWSRCTSHYTRSRATTSPLRRQVRRLILAVRCLTRRRE